MTIEMQETQFGRPHGEPTPVEPGTKDWLMLGMLYRTMVGEAIRIDNPDKVTVTVVAAGFPMPRELEREAINAENLQTSPTVRFKDLVLWRRRHYSWKPDSVPTLLAEKTA